MIGRVRAAGFALCLGLVACGSESGVLTGIDGDAPPGPIRGRIGELDFEARLVQPDWDRLVGTVTLTNRTAMPVDLRFPDTCVVLFRLYSLAEPQLVVDAHSKRCRPIPVEVTLEPGESRTFETSVLVFFILGNTMPEGRYQAILYLRPEGTGEVEISVGLPRFVRPLEGQE
ncbi:MAG TPA: hypothetical protein VMR66_07975 [Gemmatimonadota bacterium]|nr:hypothetical protein [Gemmatimonadota bacterium]